MYTCHHMDMTKFLLYLISQTLFFMSITYSSIILHKYMVNKNMPMFKQYHCYVNIFHPYLFDISSIIIKLHLSIKIEIFSFKTNNFMLQYKRVTFHNNANVFWCFVHPMFVCAYMPPFSKPLASQLPIWVKVEFHRCFMLWLYNSSLSMNQS